MRSTRASACDYLPRCKQGRTTYEGLTSTAADNECVRKSNERLVMTADSTFKILDLWLSLFVLSMF